MGNDLIFYSSILIVSFPVKIKKIVDTNKFKVFWASKKVSTIFYLSIACLNDVNMMSRGQRLEMEHLNPNNIAPEVVKTREPSQCSVRKRLRSHSHWLEVGPGKTTEAPMTHPRHPPISIVL